MSPEVFVLSHLFTNHSLVLCIQSASEGAPLAVQLCMESKLQESKVQESKVEVLQVQE